MHLLSLIIMSIVMRDVRLHSPACPRRIAFIHRRAAALHNLHNFRHILGCRPFVGGGVPTDADFSASPSFKVRWFSFHAVCWPLVQDQDVDQRDAGGDVKVEDANSQEV